MIANRPFAKVLTLIVLLLPLLALHAQAGEQPDPAGIYGSSTWTQSSYAGAWENPVSGLEALPVTDVTTSEPATPTAIPEPSSLLLLLSGISALGLGHVRSLRR